MGDVWHAVEDRTIYEGNDGLGAVVLMPGSTRRAREIAKLLQNCIRYSGLRTPEQDAWRGTHVNDQGQKVDIVAQSSGMGVGSTDIIVGEMIFDLGVKYILRVGTCGGLQKNIQVGDLIIVRFALPDESVSERYFDWGNTLPPSHPDVVEACLKAANAPNYRDITHDGVVHTKASWEREKRVGPKAEEMIAYNDALVELGVKASEMESSILFTHGYVFVEGRLHNRIRKEVIQNPDAKITSWADLQNNLPVKVKTWAQKSIYDPKEVKVGAVCVALGAYNPHKDSHEMFSSDIDASELEPRVITFGLEAALHLIIAEKARKTA